MTSTFKSFSPRKLCTLKFDLQLALYKLVLQVMEEAKILIYQSQDGSTKIEARLDNDTVWLSQKIIAELFGVESHTITYHLKEIFASMELAEVSVTRKIRATANDGKSYLTNFYNLDAIISVGYRVNSAKATQFRIWATQRLKEYLVQGYAINERRLQELDKIVKIIEQTNDTDHLQPNEAKGLLEILGKYTRSFVLLNQFDGNNLSNDGLDGNITYEIKYDEVQLRF